VNRSRVQASGPPGLVYSTCRDRFVTGRCWRFWYLQRSKKVWFRLEPEQAAGAAAAGLLFCYDGRPILHRSELAGWIAAQGRDTRPVLWGKYLGVGWGEGPQGCNLYLHLWTRWTWLHPQACGHPERFTALTPSPAGGGTLLHWQTPQVSGRRRISRLPPSGSGS